MPPGVDSASAKTEPADQHPDSSQNVDDTAQTASAGQGDADHASEPVPAPLGQNSDAPGPHSETATQEPDAADEPALSAAPASDVQMGENDVPLERVETENEANSSISNINQASLRSFATPLKLLPPLKDIEHITTPKSFGVAKDDTQSRATFKSSPVQTQSTMQLTNLEEAEEDAYDATANDTFANTGGPLQRYNPERNGSNSKEADTAAAFLDVEVSTLLLCGNDFVAKVAQRAKTFLGLQSELSFYKLNHEQMSQVQLRKFEQLQQRLDNCSEANKALVSENETNSYELSNKNNMIVELRSQNSQLLEKLQGFESAAQVSRSGESSKANEIFQLNEEVSSLARMNAENGQRISELTRDLNDSASETFSLKLELSKATNELVYIKSQKDWYEAQLKSIQDKYTDLIKKHESDSIKDSNKISALAVQNETLTTLKDSLQEQLRDLQEKLEQVSSTKLDIENRLETQGLRLSKESELKSQRLELLNVQLEEKQERILQLESYADDLKSSTADSIETLQRELNEKENQIVRLEERLRRAEDALDSELHRETMLPKLAPSAEMILQENGLGISLSTLYTEFNRIKKELILEKSQKENIAAQLQHFISELDSKKPAIANYRNQILHYEENLREILEKMEAVRAGKTESEKECSRLRNRLASYEAEIRSIRQLSKDLGRQLCFYLIHSKIREGNEDPLSAHEKKVIDQILAKSGNQDHVGESDTDQIITERLLSFASVIDLQKKNEELITTVRLLGKQLEERDSELSSFEAAAVEEAKEAILTLQSELDSVSLKYDALAKEREMLRSLRGGSLFSDDNQTDLRHLQEAKADFHAKVQESERDFRSIQSQSETKIRELNDNLMELKSTNEDLKSRLNAAEHSVEISENRLENTRKLLENSRRENEHFHRETVFWKEQASKLESSLVNKSNELLEAERSLQVATAQNINFQTDKVVWDSLRSSLTDEIQYLKRDKEQLHSFVLNLQTILKERELSSAELSKKLTKSMENYQALQEKINEKEDKIHLLSSQSDMALKAQNAKLEQVNELSQRLLEARSRIAEKQVVIDNLKKEIATGGPKLSNARMSTLVTSHDPVEDGSPILASEYNDLKDALKVAESEVTEFGLIAKSAEDALARATQSFDEFREETASKISAVEAEKSKLIEEVESQKKQVEHLEDELRQQKLQTSVQLQDLQAKLQESTFKSDSFDEMKQDFEKRIQYMNQDLESQASVSNDLQKRYESKVSESELLNLQLAQQKQQVIEQIAEIESLTTRLKLAETESMNKQEKLSEFLSGQQDELQNTQTKLRDLQYQYDLALTQIQLQKPFTGSKDLDTGDNARQVISYLRAEKESAEAKAAKACDQVSQLRVQLDGVSAELKASKSHISRLESVKLELDDANKDHARLLEQLEQLNILRESNKTLRTESESRLERINALQAEIDSMSKSTPTTDDDPGALIRTQELKLLKEENERLKHQSNGFAELENYKQRFESLKLEFIAKLSTHRNKNKDLEKRVIEVKQQLDAIRIELSTLKSSDNSLAIREQLKQVEADKAESEKKLRAEIKLLKSDFDKLKADASSTLRARLAAAKSGLGASGSDTEARIKEKLEAEWKQKFKSYQVDLDKAVELRVQERLTEMNHSTSDQVQERLRKDYEEKINSLTHSFEERLAELKANSESMATRYEFKLKVLNRKLEKLENSTPQPEQSNDSQSPLRSVNKQQATGNLGHHPVNEDAPVASRASNGEELTKEVLNTTVKDSSEQNLGKKRPLSQGNPPTIYFKRSKD